MAPTKEEEHKLKEFKDESPFKLGPAEKFLKALLDIPFAFKRINAMLYIANFDAEIEYLRRSFETLKVFSRYIMAKCMRSYYYYVNICCSSQPAHVNINYFLQL